MSNYIYDENCYLNERGNLVVIGHDDWCESPREYGCFGKFVTWMNHHGSPDDEMTPEEIICDLGLWDEFEELHEDDYDDENEQLAYLLDMASKKRIALLPVVGYDHSGLTLSTGSIRQFPDWQWDAGFAGVIYTTQEQINRPFGEEWFNSVDEILERLRDEVDTYNLWLNGNCYGYVEYDKMGNEVDSYWGFIGETTECMEHETGKLSECKFNSLKEFIKAHENDIDVMVARYNEILEMSREMVDKGANMLRTIVERNPNVKFEGNKLVLA